MKDNILCFIKKKLFTRLNDRFDKFEWTVFLLKNWNLKRRAEQNHSKYGKQLGYDDIELYW